MAHNSMGVIVAYMSTPSLALCAASPSLRLAVCRSPRGYQCGVYNIAAGGLQQHPSLTHSLRLTVDVPRYLLQGSQQQIDEGTSHQPVLGSVVWWWLLRTHMSLILCVNGKEGSLEDQQVRIPEMPLTTGAAPALHEVCVSHCRLDAASLWVSSVCGNGQVEVLTLRNCFFDDIDWIGGCTALTKLSITGGGAFPYGVCVDLRVLGSLPHLHHLDVSDGTPVDCIEWLANISPSLETLRMRNLSYQGAIFNFSIIGKLQRLSVLDISCNSFIEKIDWIASCAGTLHTVDVSACESLVDLSPLGRLPHLKALRMQWSKTQDICWMEHCQSLEKLDIKRCEEITDFTPLGKLENLKDIDVSYTHMDNTDWIQNCPLIEALDMSSCEGLADTSSVRTLAHLKSLGMDGNVSVENIGWLGSTCASSSSLESLSLRHCARVSDLGAIGALVAIKCIDIAGASTESIQWLESCSATLEVLGLSSCERIADFSVIAKLVRLKDLDVGYTAIGDADVEDIVNACVYLEKVQIRYCASVHDYSKLARLPCVKHLGLGGPNIRCIDWIQKCSSRLEVLHLSYCENITDFSAIGQLQYVKELDLSETNVVAMDWVATCPFLESIALRYCARIEDASAIRKLNHVKEIDITGTCLDDSITVSARVTR